MAKMLDDALIYLYQEFSMVRFFSHFVCTLTLHACMCGVYSLLTYCFVFPMYDTSLTDAIQREPVRNSQELLLFVAQK